LKPQRTTEKFGTSGSVQEGGRPRIVSSSRGAPAAFIRNVKAIFIEAFGGWAE